ncbi:MAG: hypothetical protein ACF8Q5_04290 [Phycisphaerales bacterium JB040]
MKLRCIVCALLSLVLLPAIALGQNEIPVTYQGRLTDAGTPAEGLFDIWIRLGDTELEDGSGSILYEEYFLNVEVSDGLFLLELNYPRDGRADEARWLELNVRPAGGGVYERLSPRQRVTPAPEAGNTRAARLQPDDSVLIGNGTDWGSAAVYNVPGAPGGSILQAQVEQTFTAAATGRPTGISGHFNRNFVGEVLVTAEILAANGIDLIASGTSTTSAPINFISFDFMDPSSDGILLCDEMYRIRVSYELTSTGAPANKAATGFTGNNPYPGGEFLSNSDLDLTAGVVVERGFAQVTVFDNGLAFLNGGLIVGPDDGGDASVVLPKGSVNPGEITGMPGVVVGVAALPADPANVELVARVLPPADGYVHAIGIGTFNANGGDDSGSLLIDSSNGGAVSVPFNSDLDINRNVSAGMTVQQVFEVQAGQQIDIYLSAPGNVTTQSLVATFYPVSYRALSPVGP